MRHATNSALTGERKILLLQQGVHQRELVRHGFLEGAAVRAAVKLQACISLSRFDHHGKPRFLCQMHHDAVLGQAIHEQRAVAEVGGVQHRALQQREAVSPDAGRGMHAQAKFSRLLDGIQREIHALRQPMDAVRRR